MPFWAPLAELLSPSLGFHEPLFIPLVELLAHALQPELDSD